MRIFRIVLKVILGLAVLVFAAVGWFWYKTRPESIPAQLPQLGQADKLAAIKVPGDGGLPDLVVGELRGSTAYFVLESRESMQAGEGKLLRALDRWVYPANVKGFSIGEAEGLGLLKWQIDKFVARMRAEARLPLYMDYEGAILRGFGLPKGHTGVVVLGPDGQVTFRHAGKVDEAKLAELKQVLGATDPPAPGPAPAFAVGPLSNAACAGKPCVVAFLSRPVKVAEVPFVEGGYKGDQEKAADMFEDPSVRLTAALSDLELTEGQAQGVFVGSLEGVKLGAGWTVTADDAAARSAFGLAPTDAALVIVDAQGRLVMRETGRIPVWKLMPVGELLGLPEQPRDAKKDGGGGGGKKDQG